MKERQVCASMVVEKPDLQIGDYSLPNGVHENGLAVNRQALDDEHDQNGHRHDVEHGAILC